MPTTAQGGFGVTLLLNGTAVVQVEDIDELVFSKIIAEATGHDSDGGYYESVATGKRRIEAFSCTMLWDKTAATHAAVISAFDADVVQTFTWSDPDGDETVEFKAHVESIGRVSAQEDAYKANVLIHPSGTATIT